MSHAKLSPSAAERWFTCPGSVVLSEGMPEKSSAFAEEGTMAHELSERILLGQDYSGDYPAGMLDHVTVYTDYVKSLGGKLLVEQRVHVNEHVYGTADAVVWLAEDQHLYVNDLKYGAGVAVEVDGNLQLKIYALAALLEFGYPAKHVTATIIQPRCPHSDGPVRSVMYNAIDLLDFHAELEDAVEQVKLATEMWETLPRIRNDEFLQPSEKGCRWCLAAPVCPKLKSKAQDMAKRVFAPGLPYDAKALAETLDYLPILEGWIKNTREFAYAEAEKGNDIPDYKLVEKRASRKWRDEASAIVMLTQQDIHPYKDPTVISPTEAEKLLPKDKRGLLDELTVKESSGHTLVHASDKRPAIKVDAASAFA